MKTAFGIGIAIVVAIVIVTVIVTVIAIAVGLAPSPAHARELWSSQDETFALEGGGYVKSQLLGMHFRDLWLYDWISGDDSVDSGGMSVTRARIGGDAYWNDFRLGLEYELSAMVMSSALEDMQSGGAFGGTGSASGSGAGNGSGGDEGSGASGLSMLGLSGTARPRLWDPDPHRGDGIWLEHNIDRAFVHLPFGPVDLRIGRQAISWGTAWFWKPTDRFSPFSPTDIDPDVKRGVDAVRAEIFLGERTSLDLVGSFERHEGVGGAGESGGSAIENREWWAHGGMRFRTGIGRYDLAVSAARFQMSQQGNWMAGLETTGPLGPLGFRAEAAFNFMEESHDWDIEAVAGLDYRFPFGLMVAGEAFYNGYGSDDPDEYLGYYMDMSDPFAGKMPEKGERLARGETFNIGRYYLGLALDQEVVPVLHVTLSAVGNLIDPSGFLMAGLDWSVVENARFSAGALVPLGEKSTGPGLDALPVPSSFDLSSEYGLMPVMGFAVLKLAY